MPAPSDAANVPTKHFFYLPVRQISTFVPRPDLHEEISKGLANDPSPSSTIQRLCVIHGLGGAGKSQLVLYYVERMRTRYSGIFWIDAANTDSIGRDFEYLHDLMYPDEKGKGPKRSSFDELFRAIAGWFSGRSERFLLVFDGADTIDDPKDPSAVDLRKVVPNYISVDVIVTTRRSSAQGFGSFSLEVSEMEEEEALQLLRNSSGLDPQQLGSSEVEEMRKIVRELGSFALAIQLTGSYISQTPRIQTDLSRYLPEYRKRRKQLLDNTPGLADQYTMSVISSWEVSFESLSRVSIIAANLLSLLSFIDSTDISESWFEILCRFMHYNGNDIVHEVRHCRNVISPEGPFTYYDLEQGFKTLRAFSFIRRMPTVARYSIHKIVHAWGYDRLGHPKKLDWIRVTMVFMFCQMNAGPVVYVEQRRVAKHAMATFSIISSIDLQTDRKYMCSRLRKLFVPFFDRLEDWSNKYKIQLFNLDCVQDSLGRDHPNSGLDMLNIVATLCRQAKYQEAVALLEEVVKALPGLRPTHLREYHAVLDRLVLLLQESGHVEGDELMWKITEEMDRLHGGRRLERNYADEQLDLKIEKILRKSPHGGVERVLDLVETCEQDLGAEHPDTLEAGHQLASVLDHQGFLKSAQTVLEGIVCTFFHCTNGSRNHLLDRTARVLISVGSLARMKGLQGDLEDGVSQLRIVWHIQTMLHGLDHSNTMTTFNNLIRHLTLQGKSYEAMKMMTEAVKDMTPGKPGTVTMLARLAFLLLTQEVTYETEEIFREMLGKYTRTLGADDSSTLQVSEILDIVAKSHKLFKHLNHPKSLEASKMTTFASADKAIDDIFRLPSVPEEDVEDARWNDEKSRGWDDKLHGRLVSTIAKYKERVRNGSQRDWAEGFKVSWYCLH